MANQLIDILACPACKGDVEIDGGMIVCVKCGMQYAVKDGIPVMLIDEPKVLQAKQEERYDNA